MPRLALIVAVGISLFAVPTFAQVCDPCDSLCSQVKDCPKNCYNPTDPKCEPPKKGDAACTPGFYKNRPELWCDPGDTQTTVDTIACGVIVFEGTAYNIGTVTCQVLIDEWLAAEKGNPRGEREAARLCLNTMFGTAENSPCEDD